MAVTMNQIKGMLNELELKFMENPRDDSELALRFGTKNYRDTDGDKSLLIVIKLSENGEYITLYCPKAYEVTGQNQGVFLKLCMMIQWMTKLVQFEFDHRDGEIRPVIEFPIEDGTLTARQLQRCIIGLGQVIEACDAALRSALEQGVIDLSLMPGLAGGPSPEQLRRILEEMLRERGLTDDDEDEESDGNGRRRPPDEL